MTLSLLLSVPHAGLTIPSGVENLCLLTQKEIIQDGDEGAAEIYFPLQDRVFALVTTTAARAIVDMNRAEDDRRKDGVIKTHTCWDVQIYREPPLETLITELLKIYYKPYHASLTKYARHVKCGIDCHTMAAQGPPVGPDPGEERPAICISNADGTFPKGWVTTLADCLEKVFEKDVSINHPFKGGYVIRSHAKELPWIQLELSRAPFFSNQEKSLRILEALKDWCKQLP